MILASSGCDLWLHKPLKPAALRTREHFGRFIQPIEIEECREPGVELSPGAQKGAAAAMRADQLLSAYLNGGSVPLPVVALEPVPAFARVYVTRVDATAAWTFFCHLIS